MIHPFRMHHPVQVSVQILVLFIGTIMSSNRLDRLITVVVQDIINKAVDTDRL